MPLVLREYQIESVHWLAATALNRLLVLDPGLGKTAAAIRAAYELGANNVLVACPAVARAVWEAELELWWPLQPRPDLLVIKPGVEPGAVEVPRPGWTVIAYSHLSRADDPWVALLANLDWDVLIIDECQYLKGGETVRTHAVYGRRFDRAPGTLTHNATRVWLLSGTPAPNHAGELFAHIRALFPSVLPPMVKSEIQFQDRYCAVRDTTQGRRIIGSNLQTITELRQRLRPHVMRRRRKDVAKDLPPLDFHDTPLAVEDTTHQSVQVRQLKQLADNKGDDVLIGALQSYEVNLATVRHQLGVLKAAPAVEFCEDLLNQLPHRQRKLVVFAHHRAVINALVTGLIDWNPVVIEGATRPSERESAQQRFQEDPKVGVLVGQIQAAGISITLTAAHTAVFVECSWVPSDNLQAALRIHRIGQVNPCTVHFLYVPRSLDLRIMRAFRRKAQELAKLM